MTTIDLYRKHKAGEISREKFLYEVRRDNNLPFITNLTSYDDAVKILKNKGIVTEAETSGTINVLAKNKAIRDKIEKSMESMGYKCYYNPTEDKLKCNKQFSNNSVLYVTIGKSDFNKATRDARNTIDVDITFFEEKIAKKYFGLVKDKQQTTQNIPDTAGKDIDLGSSTNDIPIEDSVNKVIAVVKRAEQKVSSMSGKPLNEVDTKEAKSAESVKAEVKPKKITEPKLKELHIDQANPYEYRHGLSHELDQLDDYSAEALEKAKTIVLKNLAKDANFYSNLLNQQQSSFLFKTPESQDEKLMKKLDSGGRLPIKGITKEKANVKDNLGKKEEGTTKPKGVKTMTDKGVTGSEKTIKEGKEDKHAKIKETLKKELKELISQADIVAAKRSGKPINVSRTNTTDIKALQNAQANFTTYE